MSMLWWWWWWEGGGDMIILADGGRESADVLSQGLVGHVGLLLELPQPSLQVVAGALRLLPEMLLPLLLPLQPLALQLPPRRRTQHLSTGGMPLK